MNRPLSLLTTLSALLLFPPSYAHTISEADEGSAIHFPGHTSYLLADAQATEAKTAILELEVPAKSMGAPPHTHANEDEFFYVLDGEVSFFDKETSKVLTKGQMITLPRNNVHGFYNDSYSPARLLLIVSPGEFASFFDAVVMSLKSQKGNVDVGRIIAQEAKKYEVTVLPQHMPEAAKQLIK